MSRSRAAFFTARVAAVAGAAAVMLAVPLFGAATAGADSKPAPSNSSTAHTNGDEWIG